MKKILLVLFLLLFSKHSQSQIPAPRKLFPGLFEAVQLSDIFHDNKTFVDAIPKYSPPIIMKHYNEQKNQSNFKLKKFVTDNFTLPFTEGEAFQSDIAKGVRKHIDTLWQLLSRKHNSSSPYASLISLPNDFIIPGGRFRETYYWDTYFTMLGLHESHKTAVMENMISNFAYLIGKYGFIPTGTRTYYLTRSQAPFFSMMLELLAKDEGSKVIIKYQPYLLKEYAFWMKGAEKLKVGDAYRNVARMPDGEILNRYWDDSDQPREEAFKNDLDSAKMTKQRPQDFYRNVRAAGESGWDFGSRWFDATNKFASIQTTSLIAVDLNALLYHLEQTIAKSYQLQGNAVKYNVYKTKASQRKKALLKYCWSEKDGWFMDYNWKLKLISPKLTIAGVFPLDFKISDSRQAGMMASVLKTKFLKPHGLATSFVQTGQQWDSPNEWAPMQFMAIYGLQNYHFDDLAKEIALRWIKVNITVFNETGKLTEKYNEGVDNKSAGGGEYPQQDGYGWTNGILLYLLNYYHIN